LSILAGKDHKVKKYLQYFLPFSLQYLKVFDILAIILMRSGSCETAGQKNEVIRLEK